MNSPLSASESVSDVTKISCPFRPSLNPSHFTYIYNTFDVTNDKINNSNEFKEIETSVGNIEKQIDEIISINGLVTTAENALTSIRKKSVSIQKRIEKEIISLTGLTINIEN